MGGWLSDNQAAVAAVAALVVAAVAAVLCVLVWRSLVQGRRALVGADVVIQPPVFVPAADGGLVLHVRLRNVARHPALRVAVEARVDGEDLAGRVDDATIWGTGTEGVTQTGAARFTWPVGVLDGDLEVGWSWRDGAGRHGASWTALVRVPEAALPDPEREEPATDDRAEPEAHPS